MTEIAAPRLVVPDGKVAHMPVAVLVERRKIDNPWVDHSYVAVDVLVGAPSTPPWTEIAAGPGWTRYHAGTTDIELFANETDNYKHNIESPTPSVWVVLRADEGPHGRRVHLATVNAGEVEAHVVGEGDTIAAVAMPGAVLDWVADFVARHHVERTFKKRKRDAADPESLAARPSDGGRRRRGDGGDG